jgi:hypothetical protein
MLQACQKILRFENQNCRGNEKKFVVVKHLKVQEEVFYPLYNSIASDNLTAT